MLAGVCAGIASRWKLDVTLVRIVTAVLTLVSGIGVVAYVAAWLLTPSADGPAPLAPDSPLARSVSSRGWLRRASGIALIALAALVAIAFAHSLWLGIPFGLVVLAAVLVLAVGTRLGRWTLLAFSILLVLAIGVVGVFGGSFGARTIHVASVDDLNSSYDYGAGTVKLDLTGITAVTGEHDTSVHLGRGAVTITVPRDLPVYVHARSGVGSVDVAGHKVSGFDAEQTVPLAGATDGDRIVLDVTVGAGSIKVRTT